jgi:hypothetical protein
LFDVFYLELELLVANMVAELQIKKFHVFLEDINQPKFGCQRDEAGVLYINLHRLRLSIYGRKFNRIKNQA